MGTLSGNGPSLFGKTRWAILALLYGRSDEAFYLRQIVRIVKFGQGGVQRELERLASMGIIDRRSEGHQVYFQANPKSPIYSELKSLVVKTAGVADVLRTVLAPMASRIQLAFVFGSVARSEQSRSSDVDLMVVGSVTFAEVAAAIHTAEEKIGREINPVVYSDQEFQNKSAAPTSFLTEVFSGPKVFIIGDEIELATMAGK